ncbi:hypothetical protein ACP70R_044792 [Stipagrostis hirtigluma subsp. patula]
MMGLSVAVRWWEESQLRVLVLASLFLQLFLVCTAAWRVVRIPSWLRSCIWLAYLAAAIYALATLFTRHRLPPASETTGTGSILEVLWAPVLLIHLGGPITISAYNMEDNELWARHVLTLLSQVTSNEVFWENAGMTAKEILVSARPTLTDVRGKSYGPAEDISIEEYVREAKICFEINKEAARRSPDIHALARDFFKA